MYDHDCHIINSACERSHVSLTNAQTTLKRLTHQKDCQVDFEGDLFLFDDKILEYTGLQEGIGLNTLGVLYSHFQAIVTSKHCGCLQLQIVF